MARDAMRDLQTLVANMDNAITSGSPPPDDAVQRQEAIDTKIEAAAALARGGQVASDAHLFRERDDLVAQFAARAHEALERAAPRDAPRQRARAADHVVELLEESQRDVAEERKNERGEDAVRESESPRRRSTPQTMYVSG